MPCPVSTRRIIELVGSAISGVSQASTTLEEQIANQLDETSLLAGKLIPYILPLLENEQYRRALEAWDFNMDKDSPEAALYHEVLDGFLRLLWEDELGRNLRANI